MVVWREMGGYAGTEIDRDQKGTTKRKKKAPKPKKIIKLIKSFLYIYRSAKTASSLTVLSEFDLNLPSREKFVCIYPHMHISRPTACNLCIL